MGLARKMPTGRSYIHTPTIRSGLPLHCNWISPRSMRLDCLFAFLKYITMRRDGAKEKPQAHYAVDFDTTIIDNGDDAVKRTRERVR